MRTVGKRKQNLLNVLGGYLVELESSGVNVAFLLKKLGVENYRKMAFEYQTKELTGLISEVVSFGRQNKLNMKRRV